MLSSRRRGHLLCILIVFLCAFINSAWAFNESSSAKLIEYLVHEKANLILENNHARIFLPPKDEAELTNRHKQNETQIAITKATISNLETFLNNQRKDQTQLGQELEKLQESNQNKTGQIQLVQEQIRRINSLKNVNNKTIELINENLELAHQYQQLLLKEKIDLNLSKAKIAEEKELNDLGQRIQLLNEAKDRLYQINILIQQKSTQGEKSFFEDAKLLLNNHTIILIQHRITELELKARIIKSEYHLLQSHNIKTIGATLDIYRQAEAQISSIENSLHKMAAIVNDELTICDDGYLKQQYSHLQDTITTRLQDLATQRKHLNEKIIKMETELMKQLGVRQSLSAYNWKGLSVISHQILQIPVKFFNYVKLLVFKVRDNYVWLDSLPAILFWSILGLILASGIVLRRILHISEDKERSNLSGHLYDGFLTILYRNIPALGVWGALFTIFYFNHIPLTNFELLLNLSCLWLLFRNLLLILRLTLLERVSDASGHDVRLYRQLRGLALAGEWSIILMVFSHQFPLSPLLQDVFNRIFMLFLLALSVVLWRSKGVIPELLSPILNSSKRYIRHVVSILALLIPITLLTTALIGFIGYFNLAWSLSKYQVYFLLMVTAYVLTRGVFIEGLDLTSEWMITKLKNGWLWVEVFLKPLDKIIRIALCLSGIWALFCVYGLNDEPWLIASLTKLVKYPFINISGVRITLLSTFEFIILLFVFIWASKWTREFSYRWVYRNSKDAGVRNSLSVFTQYGVILIGGFITLRVLGLDFSGMSMIVGGLAVGMGFGLRDFASNIIGGIMLLIERPVREGDLITLGEYEGQVAHIGIRSMRVSSWDNMEVLIPNAETFNKPFTNWTHQDSIVRTVIPIKVSRSDDPVIVQHLILDVLATTAEVLKDPPAQVYLNHIDEALIEFEARYFINVQLYTRFEIKSKVLFSITEQFKSAGIKPPIPPISVELKEVDKEYAAKASLTD